MLKPGVAAIRRMLFSRIAQKLIHQLEKFSTTFSRLFFDPQ